jgi:hypothetical protein
MKKFIVVYTLKPGCREQLLEAFELYGPTRKAGVSFQNAWLDTHANLVFVLYESEDEAIVRQVTQTLTAFATSAIHPVISADQV